ncbi:MAG TPA: hypothetical protein VG734_10770 [Lacunisphaera sp.]|nr:hypothetical protein [Lacunisphaera sp.]
MVTLAARAEMPAYLRSALDNFNPGVPAGWACTITTTRNGLTIVERFDPARPAEAQWSLLQYQGRSPTAEETGKYASSRMPGISVGPQSNFQKGDIEPGSLTLVQETADRAEFKGAFREEASGADKMLAHLVLHLTVRKQNPFIEKYSLTLTAPYNPVLGVKMDELNVEATYQPPGNDRPALPSTHSSKFKGRVLLISNEEDLRVTFSDFARRP